MRRRFHRKMRDAIISELLQRLMQRHRIGRRQRAIHGLRRRNDADRAERCRGMTERCPYLPHERGNRSLAASTRDGNDRLGLPGIKRRYGLRQRAAHVRHDDIRDTRPCRLKGPLGNDRYGTTRDRFIGKYKPIRLRAWHRKKGRARHGLAAVRRDSAYILHEFRRAREGGQKIAKPHQCPPWVAAAGTLAMP